MIEIRYCGSCGGYSLVEKIEQNLIEITDLDSDRIETVECGSCNLEVHVEGEKAFSEEREALDISRVTENVKSTLFSQPRAK